MVDIHCHILPIIDDGPMDWQESLQMARQAVQEGITSVIATPHHHHGRYVNPAQKVIQLVEEFNELLAKEQIPLTVLPGQEIRLHVDLLHELESGVITGLANSRYLLIELPSSDCPDYTEDLFHELILKNYVPVIAHPERNAVLANQINQLDSLIKMGALAQITTHSLIGNYGKKIERVANDMLRSNLVHFLSSDAHGNGKRMFDFQKSFNFLTTKYGLPHHDYLAQNALAIAADQPIKSVPFEVTKKKIKFTWR